jgi:hypothetical protein
VETSVSEKHLASIFGKKAGRVSMPLCYICKLQDRILWTSPATFPATCLKNKYILTLPKHPTTVAACSFGTMVTIFKKKKGSTTHMTAIWILLTKMKRNNCLLHVKNKM